MPAGGPGRFEQAYDAQAAGEIESRLIDRTHVTRATNDKEQLGPTLAAIAPVVTSMQEVLLDSGFVSEAAIIRLETDAAGRPTGLTVLAAVKREPHGRTIAQLEARPDPLPSPEDALATPCPEDVETGLWWPGNPGSEGNLLTRPQHAAGR